MRRVLGAAVLAGSSLLLPAGAAAQLAALARPEAGARATALGGAAVAAPPGAVAAPDNPAALASATHRGELRFERRGAAPGLTLESAAATVHTSARLTLAMHAHLLRREGTAAAEALGGARGTPTLSGYYGGVQAAFELWPGVAAGAGIGRVAGLPQGNARPNAWSADFGLHTSWRGLRAAAALRGVLFPSQGGQDDASKWSAGLEAPLPRTQFALAMQVEAASAAAIAASAGLLCRLARGFELRGGARLQESGHPSYGGGIACGSGAARLEYGARLEKGAATQHVLGVRFGFGEAATAPPRLVPAAASDSPREDTAPPVVPLATAPPRAASSSTPPPAATTPRAPVSPPPASPPPASRLCVAAGPYPSLESAARDAVRLRSAGLHPVVEHRGRQVFLILQRGADAAAARAVEARARGAQVPVRVEVE